MKKIIIFLSLLFSAIASFSQATQSVRRLMVTDSILIKNQWLSRVSTNLNSTDSSKDSYLVTAKAVADWVRTHGGGATGGPVNWGSITGTMSDQADLFDSLSVMLRKRDTTGILAPYLRKIDTASLSSRINLKLSTADTSVLSTRITALYTALPGYLNKTNGTDTAQWHTMRFYDLRYDTMGTVPSLSSTFIGIGDGTNHISGSTSLAYNGSTLTVGAWGFKTANAAGYQAISKASNLATTPAAVTSIFGYGAGNPSMTGTNNSFFGGTPGQNITSGSSNSTFGADAFTAATTSSFDAIMGDLAGKLLTTGGLNILIGYKAGAHLNTTSSGNILIGTDSVASNAVANNTTYIGHGYKAFRSNVAVFGTKYQVINLGDGGMTTAEFTALGVTPVAGDRYYNKDTAADVQYNGSIWAKVGGTSGGGGGATIPPNLGSAFRVYVPNSGFRTFHCTGCTLDTATTGQIEITINSDALKAPLASPTFTGTVSVPSQSAKDSSLKAANTKYVDAAVRQVSQFTDSIRNGQLKDSIKITHKGSGKWNIYTNSAGDSLFDKTDSSGYGIKILNGPDSSKIHTTDTSCASCPVSKDLLTAVAGTKAPLIRRIGTTASSSTPTPNADANDQYNVTALAAAATFGAPTGTPTDGQSLIIRIKDNATARALTWNAIYRGSTDFALPSTTVISKTMYVQFVYNAADTKWDCTGLTNGF